MLKFILEPPNQKTNKLPIRKKGADQLCSYCTADQRLCFAKQIVQSVFFENLKFQASISIFCDRTGQFKSVWSVTKRPFFSCSGSLSKVTLTIVTGESVE